MTNEKQFLNMKKVLVRNTFIRIIGYWIGFIVSYLFLLVVAETIIRSFVWYPESPVYQFLVFIYKRIFIISIVIVVVGSLSILFIALRKNYMYFISIINAVEAINDGTPDLIEIPYAELKDVGNRLNQLKVNVQRNERAAKEAEKRKNDLVMYLAHDLKTPLTSVIGYITLLKDEREISKELRQRYLNITLDKSERLEDLINEFFEITRFNLTTQVLETSKVDLTRILEQLTYEFKPMLLEKGLTCTLNSPNSFMIRCDVDKLQRALDNLLRNAVNYAFLNTEIIIDVKEVNRNIQVTFKNEGNTIPEEKLSRIFEQFYRLDSARGSNSGGAGLGLAITKEIIELHGGYIEAFSENDTICFTITLPLPS